MKFTTTSTEGRRKPRRSPQHIREVYQRTLSGSMGKIEMNSKDKPIIATVVLYCAYIVFFAASTIAQDQASQQN